MSELYNRIGINYANLRRPDERIAKQIDAALGDARSVLNVGAGSGSYEPKSRQVVALEPSAEMIRQRLSGSARVVQGAAEDLPFESNSFDAAMGILTIHHWADAAAGLREMCRVAKDRVVILTYDPQFRGQWQTEYWPEFIDLDERVMPPLSFFEENLGEVHITPVLVPHDCTDGFLYAYWRRPEASLDPVVRKGSSGFWMIDQVEEGVRRLESDLETGAWAKRNKRLLDAEAIDVGYRLVVARQQ